MADGKSAAQAADQNEGTKWLPQSAFKVESIDGSAQRVWSRSSAGVGGGERVRKSIGDRIVHTNGFNARISESYESNTLPIESVDLALKLERLFGATKVPEDGDATVFARAMDAAANFKNQTLPSMHRIHAQTKQLVQTYSEKLSDDEQIIEHE
jgi:hypothetical protein